MSARVECLPGCSCRGTDGLLEVGTPCHEVAIIRALDVITVIQEQMEEAASKLRHPARVRRVPTWMEGHI